MLKLICAPFQNAVHAIDYFFFLCFATTLVHDSLHLQELSPHTLRRGDRRYLSDGSTQTRFSSLVPGPISIRHRTASPTP